MVASVGSIVTPGEKLGSAAEFECSSGAYIAGGVVYASIVGRLQEEASPDGRRQALRVEPGTSGGVDTAALPGVGSTVTVRVEKVTPRAAHTEILVVDGRPLAERFRGTIRQQDVRQTEIDKVEIYTCFAPGDLVRAQVLSLGDRHSYFLTTAQNSLGVIEAKSVAGVPMVPVNWMEMQCPKTKTIEKRKVAKVEPAEERK